MFYYTCPICGHSYTPEDHGKQWAEKNTCRIVGDTDTDFLELYCCCFQVTFFLHKDLWCMADEDLREKLLNLIAEHITHNNICEVDGARRL